jgi:hypothetical protein
LKPESLSVSSDDHQPYYCPGGEQYVEQSLELHPDRHLA